MFCRVVILCIFVFDATNEKGQPSILYASIIPPNTVVLYFQMLFCDANRIIITK